jgi:hypothetical protein
VNWNELLKKFPWQTMSVLLTLWVVGSFVTTQIAVISRMTVLWGWFGWLVQKLVGSYWLIS